MTTTYSNAVTTVSPMSGVVNHSVAYTYTKPWLSRVDDGEERIVDGKRPEPQPDDTNGRRHREVQRRAKLQRTADHNATPLALPS
jgi:hypothetical protein